MSLDLTVLHDPRAASVLARLHGEADAQNPRLVASLLPQAFRWAVGRPLDWSRFAPRARSLYLAHDPASARFAYLLARALGARRIVELGTSFGVSTIYLALAARETGGSVVATEMVPEKAARARAHLREAGVEHLVDLRVGDARETLRTLEGPIDLFVNDAFPDVALPGLQLVAPHMRTGAVVLAGNTAIFPADHAAYLAWVRDPANGFASAHLASGFAGEMSVKVASGLGGA